MKLSSSELRMLDSATRDAKRNLNAIARMLDSLNAHLDKAFAELEAIRAGSTRKSAGFGR